MLPNQQGLTSAEALLRLRRDGLNQLPTGKSSSLFLTAWEVLKTPMFSLLVIAAFLYFFIGKLDPIHGRSNMPVWGPEYQYEAYQIYPDDPYFGDIYAESRILLLLEYISHLQAK